MWPGQAASHFRGRQHKETAQTAKDIAQCIQNQFGQAAKSARDFQMPTGVQEVVENIPVHQDGLQCRLQPDSCSFITRNIKHMRMHCNQQHNQRQSKGGRPSKLMIVQRAEQEQGAWRENVSC